MKRKRLRGYIAVMQGLIFLVGSIGCNAQLSASLTAKKNIVKLSPNGFDFKDCKLNQSLNKGDTVVTGKLSLAQISFSDKSVLRVNERSRIVMTLGTRQRDVSLKETGTRVQGDYRGPGRFQGKQALCAVRGTQFEMIEEANRDVVRCFSGQVIVTGIQNRLITGIVTKPGAITFSSESLIGDTEDWVNGKLTFLDGYDKKQSRKVVSFDPATGTVTLDAAVPSGDNVGAHFFIIQPGDGEYVILDGGMETHVPHLLGGLPVKPYPTEPMEFAGGQEFNYMVEPLSGDQESYLTGFGFQASKLDYFPLDHERDAAQSYGRFSPGIQIDGRGRSTDGTGTIIANLGGSGNGSSGALDVGIGNNGGSTGGLIVGIGGRSARSSGVFLRPPTIGGAGFTTTGSDSGLGFISNAAVLGPVYFRAGGRFGTLGRADDNQLDELMIRYRNRKLGDIQVGRFHWFSGPVSNGQLGKLMSFTSSDGIVWDLPTHTTTAIQFAYFDKINPLAGPRVGGYAGRFTFPMGLGQISAAALATSQKTLAGAVDVVYPLLPQKLEIYGEGGVDSLHQTIYTAGLYFPQLFQSYGADLTMEYSYRGQFGSSVDFSLHLPLGRKFAGLFTLSKPGSQSWRPGIGLMARY